MIGKTSDVYVDDDGYICFDHTINRNTALDWVLHSYGWEVFLGEISVYTFDVELYGVTYPNSQMISIIENMISHFRYTDFAMWEVSWISEKEYCRKHHQFDEFEDALTFYQNLEKEGEL